MGKLLKRFWSKVNKHSGVFAIVNGKKSECWLWTGSCNKRGYGQLRFELEHYSAHVFSYMISRKLNKRPKLHVLHHCDNPPCIRPSHLWKGTHQDNMDDMAVKGRDRKLKGDKHWTYLYPEKLMKGKSSKLTEKEVLRIRRLYGTGKHSLRDLASKFKVHNVSILRIIKRERWKYI